MSFIHRSSFYRAAKEPLGPDTKAEPLQGAEPRPAEGAERLHCPRTGQFPLRSAVTAYENREKQAKWF